MKLRTIFLIILGVAALEFILNLIDKDMAIKVGVVICVIIGGLFGWNARYLPWTKDEYQAIEKYKKSAKSRQKN